jgi:exosortase
MKSPFKFLLPGAILLLFVLSYLPILDKLAFRWEGGDESYCYLVVPLFAYLLWEMRDKRTFRAFGSFGSLGAFKGKKNKTENPKFDENLSIEVPWQGGFKFGELNWSAWGLVPIALSLIVIIVGELGSVETLMYLGVWGYAFGLGVFLYGRRIRSLAFPFFVLLFIVPLPLFFNQVLTFQLRLAASSIATKMLMLSGVSVFREGNIIDIGITQLQVVDACSGLRYFMPLLLLSLLMGYLLSRGWWRRGVLILLVVPLSVGLNAFRIWLTGILTVNGHAELAQDFFHDLSGWIIFMIAGGILYLVSLVLKRIGRVNSESVVPVT